MGSKSKKIGKVCAKVPVDTFLGPNMVTLPALWACVRMIVDTLLESEPIFGSKSRKIKVEIIFSNLIEDILAPLFYNLSLL